MKHSEKVLNKLTAIAEANGIDLIEACNMFCEEHDLDPVDFIKALDKPTIERLKYDAIKGNHVRKCVATAGPEL